MGAIPGLMFVLIALAVTLPIALLLGVGMGFCWWGIKKTRKQSAELQDAPLVTIKKLGKGLMKIRGEVCAKEKPLRSPLKNKKCVYYRFHVQELRSSGHGKHRTTSWVTVVDDKQWIDLTIKDESGEAEINLEQAEVTLTAKDSTSSGPFDGASPELEELMRERYGKSTKGWLFNKNMRYTESYLRDGDTVLVVGDVKSKKGYMPELYKGDHHLVVTDMNEKQLSGHYQGRATVYWVVLIILGVLMLFVCGGGGVFGIIGAGVGVVGLNVDLPKPGPGPDDNKPIPAVAKPRPIRPEWVDANMAATFLSDLQEQNVKVGWGKFGKNGMHGYEPGGIPTIAAPILVGGKKYPKALSFHPPDNGDSVVQYKLGKQYKLLKAQVALHDFPPNIAKAETPQIFKVLGDGDLLWSSNPIQNRAEKQTIRISVEDVDTLELRVNCAGSKVYAWSVWLDPQVLK